MENDKLLNIITDEGRKEVLVLDSREVAEMLGKSHSALMKDIKGSKDGKSIGIIPTLEKSNFDFSKYFVESTYKVEGNTKTYNCYLVTRMGCELLANKQQGEKGILFTAKYVERFNQMEEALKSKTQLELPTSYIKAIEEQQEQIQEQAKQIAEQQKQIQEQQKQIDILGKDVSRIEDCVGIRSKDVFNYSQYLKNSLGIKNVNSDYKCVKQRIFYEFKVDKWEQLTYNDEVISRIDELCKKYNPRKQRGLFDNFK